MDCLPAIAEGSADAVISILYHVGFCISPVLENAIGVVVAVLPQGCGMAIAALLDEAEVAAAILSDASSVTATQLPDIGVLQIAVERIDAQSGREEIRILGISRRQIERNPAAGIGWHGQGCLPQAPGKKSDGKDLKHVAGHPDLHLPAAFADDQPSHLAAEPNRNCPFSWRSVVSSGSKAKGAGNRRLFEGNCRVWRDQLPPTCFVQLKLLSPIMTSNVALYSVPWELSDTELRIVACPDATHKYVSI